MGDHHVRADLAAGHPVEVLADVIEPDEEQIHAVFLGGSRMPQRVRVFLDFVVPRRQQFLGTDARKEHDQSDQGRRRRLLHRHGISRWSDVEGDKPARQKFKAGRIDVERGIGETRTGDTTLRAVLAAIVGSD